jgi:hypothetical protein
MPAFCVAEAIARFRTLEKEARDFRQRLEERRNEATRTSLPAATRLAKALESAMQEQDLWLATLPKQLSRFMERLFASSVEQLPVDDEIVRRSSGYVDELGMSRGDALVLATIVQHVAKHPSAPTMAGFLSGNTNDFGRGTAAQTQLQRSSIKYFAKTTSAIGWMTAKGVKT